MAQNTKKMNKGITFGKAVGLASLITICTVLAIMVIGFILGGLSEDVSEVSTSNLSFSRLNSSDSYMSFRFKDVNSSDSMLTVNNGSFDILVVTYAGDVYHMGELVGNNESLPNILADAFGVVVEDRR